MSGSSLEGLSRERGVADVPEPQRRLGTRVVLPVVLLSAVVILLLIAGRDALGSRRDVEVVPVVVRDGGGDDAPAASGSVVATAAGWIEPAPFETHVSTLADGVVEEMLVLDGERVEEGQPLARLVADDAEIARDAAAAVAERAEARVRAAGAVLAAAEADWNDPVALERAVAVGEASAERTRAEKQRAERRINAARARLAEVEDRLRREEGLIETGAVSDAVLVATRLRAETLAAELEATIADDRVAAANVTAAAADLRAARRDLELRIDDRLAVDAARAALDEAEAGARAATADLREAELRLERMEIRAPRAGVVMRRRAEPGRRVMLNMDMEQSSWVVDLYDPEHLQVRVDVPLADAAAVGVGSPARIVVETLPDRTFTGEVTHIVHYADIQKNTVQFKVRVDDPDPLLRPEMLARVQVLGGGEITGTGTRSGGSDRVFAPEALVSAGTAWVVGADGDVAERRDVRAGTLRQDGWVEIREGLRPGDRLIFDPPADLAVGERIHVTGERTP